VKFKNFLKASSKVSQEYPSIQCFERPQVMRLLTSKSVHLKFLQNSSI